MDACHHPYLQFMCIHILYQRLASGDACKGRLPDDLQGRNQPTADTGQYSPQALH